MLIKLLTIVIELLLASVSLATAIRRYQDYTLPECPIDTVCSEIESLGPLRMTPAFLNTAKCKCPTGSYCPTEPGSQTINVDLDRWYGLCRDVEEIPSCGNEEIAEEIFVRARGFAGKNFTKLHCTCPRGEIVWVGTTTDSPDAKFIHHFMCGGADEAMTKRGRFGESSRGRNRGRFYFYRK